MFDVLVYLYENYWRPDACPEPKQLTRKLSAVGFEADEINEALRWLDGLANTAESITVSGTQTLAPRPSQPGSLRIYTAHEREVLGEDSIGFIAFLESAGVMAPAMREMVVDRALAVGGGRMELDDLKIIVLMVFWSLGEEPDALVLDELFVDSEDRVIH
jgi:Smg protein